MNKAGYGYLIEIFLGSDFPFLKIAFAKIPLILSGLNESHSPMKVRILIVDDHLVFAEGLKALLETQDNLEVVGLVCQAREVIPMLEQQPVDLLFTDLSMPDINGVELCEMVHKSHPEVRIMALTMHDDSILAKRVIRKGAMGYLLKNSGIKEIKAAIEALMEGRTYLHKNVEALFTNRPQPKNLRRLPSTVGRPHLTKREQEVLQLVCEGLTASQIAEKLFITSKSVDFHRSSLLSKFGVQNTALLVKLAVEYQFVS